MKSVGIIGAGAAGLCAAKHCLETNSLRPIIWEQTFKVGGTWVYNPDTGVDKYGLPIHSSMYKNLRTNLPKEVMAFPDYSFPDGPSFISHTDVLNYLENYTQHFNISPHIKFGHHIENVEPDNKNDPYTKWVVTARNIEENQTNKVICDAIVICNGHYSVPKLPNIKNLDNFMGRKLHSHNYREPSKFKGLKVAVLGAMASGIDISIEISSVAKSVFLSHNHPLPLPTKLPPNLTQCKGITEATECGFILSDGSSIDVDAIVYCTGYEYVFPFLNKNCGISVKENRVDPLYKQMINCNFPTMSFIGLPYQTAPFVMFDIQVQFFLKILCGAFELPSTEEMRKDYLLELHSLAKNGVPKKHFHKMGSKQWIYNKHIAELANINPPPKAVVDLYTYVGHSRKENVLNYRNCNYLIHHPELFGIKR